MCICAIRILGLALCDIYTPLASPGLTARTRGVRGSQALALACTCTRTSYFALTHGPVRFAQLGIQRLNFSLLRFDHFDTSHPSSLVPRLLAATPTPHILSSHFPT
jgi:hypothetical protein